MNLAITEPLGSTQPKVALLSEQRGLKTWTVAKRRRFPCSRAEAGTSRGRRGRMGSPEEGEGQVRRPGEGAEPYPSTGCKGMVVVRGQGRMQLTGHVFGL